MLTWFVFRVYFPKKTHNEIEIYFLIVETVMVDIKKFTVLGCQTCRLFYQKFLVHVWGLLCTSSEKNRRPIMLKYCTHSKSRTCSNKCISLFRALKIFPLSTVFCPRIIFKSMLSLPIV